SSYADTRRFRATATRVGSTTSQRHWIQAAVALRCFIIAVRRTVVSLHNPWNIYDAPSYLYDESCPDYLGSLPRHSLSETYRETISGRGGGSSAYGTTP